MSFSSSSEKVKNEKINWLIKKNGVNWGIFKYINCNKKIILNWKDYYLRLIFILTLNETDIYTYIINH